MNGACKQATVHKQRLTQFLPPHSASSCRHIPLQAILRGAAPRQKLYKIAGRPRSPHRAEMTQLAAECAQVRLEIDSDKAVSGNVELR
jgi:hypothetical protein